MEGGGDDGYAGQYGAIDRATNRILEPAPPNPTFCGQLPSPASAAIPTLYTQANGTQKT